MKKHIGTTATAGVVLLACIGSSVPNAHAVPSTINFTGQIPAEPLFGTPTTTATVTGSYIFETATPDSSADPATGIYLGSITALSFTVDGKNGAHPGFSNSGDITVRNPGTGPLNDDYEITSNVFGPTVAGITPIKFSFFVEGFPFSTPLSGKGLPTSLPPGGFEDDSLNITFLNSAFPGEVFTTQGVIFFPTVPEPTSVLLLGSGFGAPGMVAEARRDYC